MRTLISDKGVTVLFLFCFLNRCWVLNLEMYVNLDHGASVVNLSC